MKVFYYILFCLILSASTTILYSQVTIKNNVITVDAKKLDKVYKITKNFVVWMDNPFIHF